MILQGTDQPGSSPAPTFSKGMTLDEYMSGMALNPADANTAEEESYQNLFEDARRHPPPATPPDILQTHIPEIQEESNDQSVEYSRPQQQPVPIRQPQMNRREPAAVHVAESGSPQRAMNATAYFPQQQERHNFRVKHVSNSPFKRQKEHVSTNAAMTLYGHKFRSINKEPVAQPEMVTFYGGGAGIAPKESRKDREGKTERKRKGSKKGHLDLHELMHFEQKIRSTYSQKLSVEDLRVDGVRDRLRERGRVY